VIVVVRGGGWHFGDKEGFAFIAGQLAAAGFATASVEYRPTEEARFPAAVHDVKAAVRWLRANAARFGLDANRIGAIGGSAGGQLVALVGTSASDPELEGDGGNAGVSSRLAAIVAMAPVTDFRHFVFQRGGTDGAAFLGPNLTPDDPRLVAASPVTHVTRHAPPLLLMHSRTDAVVPYQQSLEMKDRYDALALPVELITLETAPHAFWNYSRWFPEVLDQAVAFFRRTLR
jgi:pectinesterase